MISFIFGFIVGFLNATLVLILVNRYQLKINRVIQEVKTRTGERGAVFMASSEEDEAKQSIIKKNQEKGGSTFVKDLYED